MYLRCDLVNHVPHFSPKKTLPPLKHRPSYGLVSILNFLSSVLIMKTIYFTADFDKHKRYDCPVPCVIDTYNPSISVARYPTNNGADKIAKSLSLKGTTAENREWVR